MAKPDPRQRINENADPGVSRKVPIHTPKRQVQTNDAHAFHWVRDKVDTRDYIYKIQKTNTATPNVVDLRPFCTPIEDQGNLGSCTGQAVAGAIELINNRNRKPIDVSRLYIYYFERMLMGTINYDSGAYIRDGIKATNKYGAPLERLWPYNIAQFRTQPTKVAMEDGSRRKVTRYERITNFDGCIDALSRGFPVIFGFLVYSSFLSASVSRTGNMPYPNLRKESLLGGHAVLLVGYDMKKQVFIVRNSWGNRWGDKGYFYMPFDVVRNQNMSFDFWTITSVENP